MKPFNKSTILPLLFIALLSTLTPTRAAEVPFEGDFKIPALKRIWATLNEPSAFDFALEWKSLDPQKDHDYPEDFWRQWSLPSCSFFAGVKIPSQHFVLANLYRQNKLHYPLATLGSYTTFYDLHESLAWLYAFQSPANPLYKNRALRLRARQLALIHLVGMVQNVPGGNIIGGWSIQYGNCLAWNAHSLKLLEQTEPLDPDLKAVWIDCLDYIAKTLDALDPEKLQTSMGHWNLWPVCGAFYLWQASGKPEHQA